MADDVSGKQLRTDSGPMWTQNLCLSPYNVERDLNLHVRGFDVCFIYESITLLRSNQIF